MIKPFIFEKPYKCPHCGKLAIELFDIFGNKLNYPQMCTLYDSMGEIPPSVFRKDISCFRCTNCNTTYPITWIDSGKFPRPMVSDVDLRVFKELFKKKA